MAHVRSRTRLFAWAGSVAVALGGGYALVRRGRAAEPDVPSDLALDRTADLLTGGYTFISTQARRLGTDVFATRVEGRRAVCVTGEAAARMFFTPDRFTRQRAIPASAVRLLQDVGSVQTLDGAAHRRRKALFMEVLGPQKVAELVAALRDEWRAAVLRWERMPAVYLHHEVRKVLCRSVCRWAGVPLREQDVGRRTREFGAMIDAAGTLGPRNWRAAWERRGTERWIADVIRSVRKGRLRVAEGSAVHRIAHFCDERDALLDVDTAAVELINILRPTIAVAGFIAFEALALHEHPECRAVIASGEEATLEAFSQEVRRFYPFFPAIGGRVREPFDWRGFRFERGVWVLMDVYGTNHDPRIWGDPDTFRPQRFLGAAPNDFALIAQGGGSYTEGHRCPGEPLTVELMKAAARLLTADMRYDVPPQHPGVDFSRIPALPYAFKIANVRRVI